MNRRTSLKALLLAPFAAVGMVKLKAKAVPNPVPPVIFDDRPLMGKWRWVENPEWEKTPPTLWLCAEHKHYSCPGIDPANLIIFKRCEDQARYDRIMAKWKD